MKKTVIPALVAVAIAGIILLKHSAAPSSPLPTHTQGIPRLLDLGSTGCTACKLMEPVLEELKIRYDGRLQVDFIDVWKHEEAASLYSIELIPVQIFFDEDGRELYRHEGFISADEIESKFAELGIVLNAG